jgi:hypothetical protein
MSIQWILWLQLLNVYIKQYPYHYPTPMKQHRMVSISFSAQSFILHPVNHLPLCGFSSSHLVSWSTKPIHCRLPIKCASSYVDSSDIQSLLWLNCSASQQCNQLLYEEDFFVACRYRLSFNNKSGLKDWSTAIYILKIQKYHFSAAHNACCWKFQLVHTITCTPMYLIRLWNKQNELWPKSHNC